jgi:hypothetical protein
MVDGSSALIRPSVECVLRGVKRRNEDAGPLLWSQITSTTGATRLGALGCAVLILRNKQTGRPQKESEQ